MKLKHLLQDDDAVSPVIGVILMVAITVILAAVIGTFVLNLGDNLNQNAPTASFSFNEAGNNEAVEIVHNGGDSIPADQLIVDCGGTDEPWDGSGSVTAGSTHECTGLDSSGDTVKVIWKSEDGGSSQTLDSHDI